MGFNVGDKHPLPRFKNYYFISKHRTGGNKNASVWKIITKEEFDLACEGIIVKNYVENKHNASQSYNVKSTGTKLKVIGKSTDNRELKLGKFVTSDNVEWHGYPADYVKKTQDIPLNVTLEKLLNDSKITKKQMSLISQGKKGI